MTKIKTLQVLEVLAFINTQTWKVLNSVIIKSDRNTSVRGNKTKIRSKTSWSNL